MSNEEIKALSSVAITQPKSRVDHKKEWYVSQLAIAQMENHALKCKVERLEGRTVGQLFALLVKAIVGNKEATK